MGNVIELFKKKSNLFLDKDKKLKGSPHFTPPSAKEIADHGDRMERIRASLEKINSIQRELKKRSTKKSSLDF